MFGIKESDTIGSKSQGFFYAKRKTKYFLESKGELFGINISFDSPPLSCEQAVLNGFSSGINIFEASINCDYESFDISCVDGVNAKLQVIVSDSNWNVGVDKYVEKFNSTENILDLENNVNLKGVFPYRCSDCIDINPHNIPKNCFNYPENCSEERICQVNRYKSKGGIIYLNYK